MFFLFKECSNLKDLQSLIWWSKRFGCKSKTNCTKISDIASRTHHYFENDVTCRLLTKNHIIIVCLFIYEMMMCIFCQDVCTSHQYWAFFGMHVVYIFPKFEYSLSYIRLRFAENIEKEGVSELFNRFFVYE